MPVTPAEVMQLVAAWRAEATALRDAQELLVNTLAPVVLLDQTDLNVIERYAVQLEAHADELEATLS